MKLIKIGRLTVYAYWGWAFGPIPSFCGCSYFEIGPLSFEIIAKEGA